MYEGLVGPTEASWSQAAAMLNDHALDEALLPSGTALTPEAQAAGERLHSLGKEALAAGTPEARGRLFAEALTTCATCHAAVGVGEAALGK
jgi:cytochrome c5